MIEKDEHATLRTIKINFKEKKEVIQMCENKKRQNDDFLHAKPADCGRCMEE